MFVRSIFVPVLVLQGAAAIALTACSSAQGGQEASAPIEESAGTATSILNAGVMTELGAGEDGMVKFLFDPLYDNHFGSLAELPPELIEAIVTGAAPYDGVDAVFVSHAHGDHFSASQLTRMLAAQGELVVVAPAQALEQMRADAGWEQGFEGRVRAIALDNGEASESFELAGATIEAFRTPHTGWPERHANVHNLTFRVSAPAGEGMVGRVMHLGDADPGPEHYAALEEFLQARRTSLAMVPHWHYGARDFATLLEETFNAESAVAIHVPVAVPAGLREGSRPYFSSAGEMLEIVAVE